MIHLAELFFKNLPQFCIQGELKTITSWKMLQLVNPPSSWMTWASTMAHVRPPAYSLTRPSVISLSCQGAGKTPLPPSMGDNPILHTMMICNAVYSMSGVLNEGDPLFQVSVLITKAMYSENITQHPPSSHSQLMFHALCERPCRTCIQYNGTDNSFE